LSGRVTPGFSGDIVLRSRMDRRYSGRSVEALTWSSEVLDLIRSLGEGGEGAVRKVRSRIAAALIEDLVEDPFMVQDACAEHAGSANGLGTDASESIRSELEAISERARRMCARLD